ncbi:plasmid replication protein, partial [Listeria monocytogenes]|nr:plasmid replication protein [Listeria monocytogenes]HAK9906185.1 plasmid replication protein [Listeria monocytogenes]
KKILKQSNRIISRVEGKGRSAKTLLSTVALVVESAIRHAIAKKHEQKEKYISFLATFTEAAQYITNKFMKDNHKTTAQNAILAALPVGDDTSRQMLLLLDQVYKKRSNMRIRRLLDS